MKRQEVKKYIPLLKIIKKLKNDEKRVLVKHLDSRSIECLSCVFRNAIANPTLGAEQQEHLRQRLWDKRNDVRFIANAKKSADAKKRRLSQLGGNLLGLIIGQLLPLVASLLTSKK